MATDKNNTGLIAAVAGGGALLLWLLWRGRGKGKTGNDPRSALAAPIEVRLYGGDRIDVDGVRADLDTAVAHARAAGSAHVRPSGDTRHGWVEQVSDALRATGAQVYTYPPPRAASAS